MLSLLQQFHSLISAIVPELTDLLLYFASSMTRRGNVRRSSSAKERLGTGRDIRGTLRAMHSAKEQLRSIALLTCNVVISGKARQRRTMRLRTIHLAKADKSEGSPTGAIIIASNCLL